MNRTTLAAATALCVAMVVASCTGSGNGTSSPTPTSPTNQSLTVTVSDLQASARRTDTGATYHVSFIVRLSGNLGATVTGITINLASGTRAGSAVFDNASDALPAGGILIRALDVTSTNGSDLFTQITSVRVSYTDSAGRTGTATSGTAAITPPASPGPTPACSVTLSPTSVTLGASGSAAKGTVQLNTTSGCSWSATSADSWLNLSPKAGTGSGTLSLEATDNISSTAGSRTSRISAAGTAVSVTQSGQASSPAPPPSPAPAPAPPAPPTPPSGCCKVCTTGKPCGDTCIARDLICHVGPGCACSTAGEDSYSALPWLNYTPAPPFTPGPRSIADRRE
jgi:BACON domain-containing protein